MRLGSLVAIALLAVSCSSDTSTFEECQRAAVAQANAEIHASTVYEGHVDGHDPEGGHDNADLIGARVTMILAEAATQRHC